MKKIIFMMMSVLLLLGSMNALGQTNPQSGYIITNANDTINGINTKH